jgi:tetratricopeptide (TPR) repeat protein
VRIPAELVEAFVTRRASVFAGAGISIGAGLPSWAKLVEPLAQEIDDFPEGGVSPLDIAQYYLNEHHAHRLAEKLLKFLDRDDVAPTAIHRKLVQLPVSRIYTTNFDNLLERACVEQNIKYQVVSNAARDAIARPDRLNVIKLHGDLTEPDSLVIAAEDFEEYFATHRAVAHRVAAEMRDNTLLFVGYSFTDPDLRTIIRAVRKDAEGFARNHFILLLDPNKPVIVDLERRGLKVVSIQSDGDRSRALLDWIGELDSRIRSEMPPPAEQRAVTHSLPPIATDLVGRDRDLRNVLELLAAEQIVMIVGAPGVGKTSLAVNVGHCCAKQPEFQGLRYIVWVTGRGKPAQQSWLNDVFNTVGVQLGFPVITQKPSDAIDEKKTIVNFLLGNHRTLIVIDSLDTMTDPNLFDWIRTIPSTSKLLVTSRGDTASLGARYELKGLQEPEAIQLLRRYARDSRAAELLRGDLDSARRFVAVTCGNPQAMKLAFGYLKEEGSRLDDVIDGLTPISSNVDLVFDQLFKWCWEKLSYDAERLLLTTTLFPETSRLRREALEASSGFTQQSFDKALEQVLRFGLIERSTKRDQYILHPKTRSFALQQLAQRPKFAEQGRERCAQYYLEFVQSNVVRPKPETRYWNALVTESMKAIDDPEWQIIRELMDWCAMSDRSDMLVSFLMLLVHYLDSRFLNRERLKYVSVAIEALSKTHRLADEALLRIDALGWTYVEESNWERAHYQIDTGYELARRLDTDERTDLIALANAWKARALIEEGNRADAQRHIQSALEEVGRCNSWIRVRVHMAAGDIALKEHRSEDALRHFRSATEAAKEYGGEGGGYQLYPRIGLALIDLDRFDEAQAKFQSVRDLEGIPIGNLYGEYGLALVAYKRGRVNEANIIINRVRQQLEQKATSNLVWTLLNDLYAKLHSRGKADGSHTATA